MKHLVFEIIRQKWQLLSILVFLILTNIILSVVTTYQLPHLAELQTKWSDIRRQAAGVGRLDATTLHQQGRADLEKLMTKIPEKRLFARVLSVIIEAAASNAVEVGAISYKPVKIKEEPILSYQLSLSAGGSYAAVKSFLADMQKNQELIVVDSVAFSNSDLFVENVVMNMRLTVYLREGA